MATLTFAILAAGSGTRLGGEVKQFRLLGERPLWQWSLEVVRQWKGLRDEAMDVLLVVPPSQLERYTEVVQEYFPEVLLCPGGASRAESALAATKATKNDFVMFHDSARPFLSLELCGRIWKERHSQRAVIPVLPVTDAIKTRGGNQWASLPREELCCTQTPQLFPRAALADMLNSLSASELKVIKDEAELWLAHGGELIAVDGIEENYKITTPADWSRAVASIMPNQYRSGMGYDVHALVPHRPLVLGGVTVPSPLGLSGHSDADILSHVLADALLSAAKLPDIGTLWPANDDQWKNYRSLELLAEAVRLVQQEGWAIQSLSVVLSAQIPRLAVWHQEILQSLHSVVGDNLCTLTFKSGEAVAPVGSGQAMTAWAVALVSSVE